MFHPLGQYLSYLRHDIRLRRQLGLIISRSRFSPGHSFQRQSRLCLYLGSSSPGRHSSHSRCVLPLLILLLLPTAVFYGETRLLRLRLRFRFWFRHSRKRLLCSFLRLQPGLQLRACWLQAALLRFLPKMPVLFLIVKGFPHFFAHSLDYLLLHALTGFSYMAISNSQGRACRLGSPGSLLPGFQDAGCQ